jgi:hypothetical protein
VILSGPFDADLTVEINKEGEPHLGFPGHRQRRACTLEVDVTDDAEVSGDGEDADKL